MDDARGRVEIAAAAAAGAAALGPAVSADPPSPWPRDPNLSAKKDIVKGGCRVRDLP